MMFKDNWKKACCVMVVLNMFFLTMFVSVHPVKGYDTPLEILCLKIDEYVTILDNGEAEVNITITASSSDLADMYRETLAAPKTIDVDEEIPIPEGAKSYGHHKLGEGVIITSNNN